jgi:excisionase family DNA binding protein
MHASYYNGVAMKQQHTTKQVADNLGVHRVTLQNWIAEGKVPAPAIQNIGGGLVRLWSEQDIRKARKAIAKLEK